MSIASEITRLQTAKADLKTAIEGKGVTVAASATLDAYADLVDAIETGGGGAALYPLVNGTHTFSNGVTVTVTKGYHVVVVIPETLDSDIYANFSDITENTANANTTDNLKNKTKKFTIAADKTAVFGIYNFPHSGKPSFNAFGTGSSNIGLPINQLVSPSGFSTKYFTADTDVGCFFFVTRYSGTYEFDVAFYMDNIKCVGE